ncbi:phage holin family protein [Actinocorallia populi]|uniref:phage holin family protein n=1 Tax=Actinocorallia populi TaxID=2079200 RepID=UPI000D08C867|nr:phage holin family protein [Actinocorallia populi]
MTEGSQRRAAGAWAWPEERQREEPGTGELIQRATDQLSDLVRAEIRLAVAEVKDKGKRAGIGAGMLGGAGVVAGYGVAALLVAAIAALDLVLPLWAAALIVAAVLLLVALAVGMRGRKEVTEAVPPTPERAVASTRRDINEIKERAHR